MCRNRGFRASKHGVYLSPDPESFRRALAQLKHNKVLHEPSCSSQSSDEEVPHVPTTKRIYLRIMSRPRLSGAAALRSWEEA